MAIFKHFMQFAFIYTYDFENRKKIELRELLTEILHQNQSFRMICFKFCFLLNKLFSLDLAKICECEKFIKNALNIKKETRVKVPFAKFRG